MPPPPPTSSFFFFNDTATTEIYTLSLHDALPISHASVAIRNARLVSSIKEANRYLQAEIDERYGTLIGKSAGIRAAVKSARKVAETSATILLLGETDRKSTRLNSSH